MKPKVVFIALMASLLVASPPGWAGAKMAGAPIGVTMDAPEFRDRLRALSGAGYVLAACCKTCRKGKACGDSCISRSKTCRKGAGCACDG